MTEENTSEAVGESDDEIRTTREDDIIDDPDVRDGSPISDYIDPVIQKKTVEKTHDDLEFEQAFDKMAVDSYQERMRESVKGSTKDIPVPMMAKSGKKTYDQLQAGNDTSQVENSVPFVLMLRGSKGGKQQFKTFKAPSDSPLAINLKLQEQKIKEENEKVKR